MTTTAPDLYGPVVFAVTFAATLGAHEIGDHLAQTEHAALGKQHPGPAGRRALNCHIRSYTLTHLACTYVALKATGLPVPLHAVLAGTAVNAITHWITDRGPALAWLATKLGKANHDNGTGYFYRGCGLATGRTAMDQATHRGILPIAAAVTAVLARRSTR